MKTKYQLLGILLLVATGLMAQSPTASRNYVMETVVKADNKKTVAALSGLSVDSVNRTLSYFDGLGRPLQTVQWQASPGKRDIVQHMVYDALGRETKKYQPYAEQTSADGSFKASPLASQAAYYGSGSWDANVAKTPYPYTIALMEPSPAGRMLEQGAPGAVWQPYSAGISGSGHTVKLETGFNVASEVALWTVTGSGASTSGSYAANKLYRTVSRDENWTSGRAGTVEEFKNSEGKIILKRIWETGSTALSTYYLYDSYGNLRYVVPPAVSASFVESDAAFKNFVYAYHYDDEKRLIEKKIPGKGWEQIVYNKLDQVVLTRDSVQRTNGQWLFTKYDRLGRTVITGVISSSSSRATWQTNIDAQGVLWEDRVSDGGLDYTNNTLPDGGFVKWGAVNYYDDYTFRDMGSSFPPTSTVSLKTRGMLTGTRTWLDNGLDSQWSILYYDEEGRLQENIAQNHLGGTDRTINTYNFAGELTASIRTHIANSTTTTVANRFVYDHMGRKISTKENINAQGEVVLNKLEYNEIGQLKKKSLHSTDSVAFLQHTKYAYNERGWLKNSTSAEFSIKLGYDTLSSPQYNGNISTQLWGSSYANQFDYTYDKLNRLTNGTTSSGITMGEALTYDNMGNILTLDRDGSPGSYTYNGNQLSYTTGGLIGSWTYLYDGNGNATQSTVSSARIAVAVGYNHLNLPITVAGTGISLAYTYNAAGQKLKKVNSITSTTTDYVQGIQYTNGTIDFIQTEEGRALNNSGTYSYEYNLTDHLGNVRQSFNQHPVTGLLQKLQEDDYYAFGLRKVASSGANNYLYNSKELQDELGQYDYGARLYDPVVGRWNVIDNKSELYFQITPYAYAANTPTNAIDPDGHIVIFINGNHLDGSGGSASYWRGSKNVYMGSRQVSGRYGEYYNQPIYKKQEVAFDKAFMNKVGDHNESLSGSSLNPYIDGSRSGEKGSLMLDSRIDAGYEQGQIDAAILINSLSRTNGVITESLKIVTHSMGAAFGKGYIQAIVEYAKSHPKLAQGLSITEYDFAAFQQNKLSAIEGVPLFQFDNKGDQVVGGIVGGVNGSKHAKQKGRQENGSNDNVSSSGGHSILDFMDAISTLQEGPYKFVNGNFVKQ